MSTVCTTVFAHVACVRTVYLCVYLWICLYACVVHVLCIFIIVPVFYMHGVHVLFMPCVYVWQCGLGVTCEWCSATTSSIANSYC